MPSAQRQGVMDCIRQQFPNGESQRLLEEFPSLQMLSWGEVRELASAGVEIGSHGVNHEIHHEKQPEAVRRGELTKSKKALENQLNRHCRFFAFPNGDFSQNSANEVGEAGYVLGFTMETGTVMEGSNPYLLPRLETNSKLRTFVRNFFWNPPARLS